MAAVAPASVTVTPQSSGLLVSWPHDAANGRYRLERQEGPAAPWVNLALVFAPNATFLDSSPQPDLQYRYRVAAAEGVGGFTGWTVSDWSAVAPSAPQQVTAVRDAAEGSVELSWPTALPTATGFRVEHSYSADASLVAARWVAEVLPSTYTGQPISLTGLPGRWHEFRVAAVNGAGQSAWSVPSNVVGEARQPMSPTPEERGPLGVGEDGYVTWGNFHPDGARQSKWEVRWRHSTLGTLTTSASSEVVQAPIPASLRSTPGDITWQVQTWGIHPDPSPLSPARTFRVARRPLAPTITSPTNGQEVGKASLDVAWTYHANGGSPQEAVEVELVTEGGTRHGPWSIPHREFSLGTLPIIEPEMGWSVFLRVMNADGLWSPAAEAWFYARYTRPPSSGIAFGFDEESGAVILNVTTASLPNITPATRMDIQRSVDGGLTWEYVIRHAPPNLTVLDFHAPFGVEVLWRVATIGDGDQLRINPPAAYTPHMRGGWIYLTAPGGETARIASNPGVRDTAGRDVLLVTLDGAALPTELAGPALPRSGTVAGDLIYVGGCNQIHNDATPRERWVSIVRTPGAKLLRDPRGRRLWVSVTEVDFDDSDPALTRVSFAWTQMRHVEEWG